MASTMNPRTASTLSWGTGHRRLPWRLNSRNGKIPCVPPELSTEQNENMIDGIINNAPPEPQPEEPEQLSFEDVAAGSGQTQEETPGAEPTQTAVR